MSEDLGEAIPLLTAAVIVASLLPFLLAPLRARIFGPDGRGEFAFFQSSLTIITAVSALGYRHAYYRHAHDHNEYKPILGRAGLVLTSAIGLAVGLPLSAVAFVQISTPVGIGLAVASLGGPLYALTQLMVADSQWHTRRVGVAALAGGPPAAEFGLSLVFVALQKLSVATGIVITLMAEALRVAIAVSTRGRRRKPAWRTESESETSNPATANSSIRLLKNAALLAPAVLAPLLASNIDAVIYGALGPAVLLGYYAVAKIATSVLILAATTLEGRFLKLAAARGITKSLGVAVLFLGVAAVFGTVVGYLVIPPLFGDDFRPSALALPATASAGGAAGLFVLLGAQAARVGHGRAALLTAVACFVMVAVGCTTVGASASASPSTMALPIVLAYTTACVILATVLRKNEKD